VIAVTCRNGEHFSIDPTHIERVEKTSSDTVILLVDGAKFVVGTPFDDVLLMVRDHHATDLVLRKQLLGGVAEIAEAGRQATLFVERRQFRRDAPDDDGD
jgi:uncharacterized protein YlzI (FlbEa/FlbD family)